MSKVRVHELAKELNVESKVLMTKLKATGAKVISHQSTLTDQQVLELKRAFGGASNGAAAPSGGDGKPKVVVRRRAAATTVAEPEASEGAVDVELEDEPVEPEPAPVEEAPPPPPAPSAPPPPVAAPAVAAAAPSPVPTPSGATMIRSMPRPEARDAREAPAAAPAAPSMPPPPRAPQPGLEAGMSASASPSPSPSVAPRAVPPPPPAPRPAAAPSAPPAAAGAGAARRRELGGATIVRKATPEEVEKLESANKSRQTGRKEDHRGTRVTGLGLLSNRVSAGDAGPGGQPGQPNQGPPPEGEDWGQRPRGIGPTGTSLRDKKAQEEAEDAARKKAAKLKRANIGLNARALLQQAEELTSPDEEVQATEVAGRTVYTPMAPRTKRDIKRRKDLKKTMITTPRAAYRVINMGDSITVAELAKALAVKATDLIKKLMTQGVMATINQSLDLDTATLLASEYHFEVKSEVETVEDILMTGVQEHGAEGDPTLVGRAPIVTIMGHVDHGKTSLLDAIRQANVASGEAGGITQHIGAYAVEHKGKKIAFLDTPGHEAFSSMRARGAKVTDIVVLVVAADDGVMPQTVEAINHAKAANVPLIVAVNKIDRPQINLDRVYTELTEHGIQAEEWGGEVQFIKTSATKKTGIDELLEAILLQAEVLDLKASKVGFAEGAVIEAHLDKNRGPVATIMVQRGTLKVGDHLVAGVEYGRVRAMVDHNGKEVPGAEPSTPVEIIGLSGVPMAGDKFNVVLDEKTAREAAGWRAEQVRKAQSTKSSAQSLADLLAKVKSSEVPEVPMVLKGDTRGSVEAISESINKLSNEKVKNRIVHAAVGGVTESDITLAAASGAVIIAFNVRAGRGLDDMAEKNGVAIRYFSIIYEIVDAIKAIMVGKLPPIVSEVVLGHAEVRKPISVPKIGTIAGSAVLDGKITRNALCRLLRDSIVIYSGKLGSLRRFKDDVKEVVQGYECGIGIEGYNDLKEGDVIEAYVLEETAATL